MRSDEFASFSEVIGDLCAAYDRQPTDARNRAFWEVLKGFHLHDVRRAALKWRNSQRKMPAPVDLKPERSTAPVERNPVESEDWSRWAIAANKILLAVAYQDERRGFGPIAIWGEQPARGWSLPLKPSQQIGLVDGSLLERCLAAKRDYVRMAEEAEAQGEPMDGDEFQAMCKEGFEKLLGTAA